MLSMVGSASWLRFPPDRAVEDTSIGAALQQWVSTFAIVHLCIDEHVPNAWGPPPSPGFTALVRAWSRLGSLGYLKVAQSWLRHGLI